MHKFNTARNKGANHTHIRLDRISAVRPDNEHSVLLVDGAQIEVEESEEEVLEVIEKFNIPLKGFRTITKEEEGELLAEAVTPVGVDGDRATAATGKLTKVPAKKAKTKFFSKNSKTEKVKAGKSLTQKNS